MDGPKLSNTRQYMIGYLCAFQDSLVNTHNAMRKYTGPDKEVIREHAEEVLGAARMAGDWINGLRHAERKSRTLNQCGENVNDS